MDCPINALSIDVEEWYHPQFMRKHFNLPLSNLVADSVEILLDILNRFKTNATFFILGEVAAQNPGLIKKIYAHGHEIASHGFSHRILQEIGPDGLREELIKFKKVINAILGDIAIKGFRAPSFSLNQDTSWAVDILKEMKIKYDSSIFPMRLGLYGVNKAPLYVYGLNSNNIIIPDAKSNLKELPVTMFEIGALRFPISGGFYLRLIPVGLQKIGLKLINKRQPFMIYIHPWECNPKTPKIRMNKISSFISYYNIKSSLIKLETLLNNFRFSRIDHILGV